MSAIIPKNADLGKYKLKNVTPRWNFSFEELQKITVAKFIFSLFRSTIYAFTPNSIC